MPSTGHGIIYPDSSGNTQIWTHLQNLADSTEAALDAYEVWNSWTPVWPNVFTTLGTGAVNQGFYMRIGDLVIAQFRTQLGTSPTIAAGVLKITLPIAAHESWGGTGLYPTLGSWTMRDNSLVRYYSGSIGADDAAGASVTFQGAWNGTAPLDRADEVIPFAWAANDIVSGVLTYRAA